MVSLILVVNSGSSSLKFALYRFLPRRKNISHRPLFKGHIDGIGNESCTVNYWSNYLPGNSTLEDLKNAEKSHTLFQVIKTHSDAISYMLKLMKMKNIDSRDIVAIGHRVVHGGSKYTKSVIVNKQVIRDIERLSFLAPLHNPHNLAGINACIKHIPKAKNIAVFDTAFHTTIPDLEKAYAIPRSLSLKYHIKRYGFHGTSYKYVYSQLKKIDKRARKVIICHLGNGSSICAIKDGKSIATTMGYTPLEGLPMGTRSGTIDPGIVAFLAEEQYDVDNILNKDSGLKALAGTNDMREIWDKAKRGDKRSLFAIDYLSSKIAEFIGSYATKMDGVDTIVFTGGLGEKAFYVREKTIKRLDFLGARLDKRKNSMNHTKVSSPSSKIRIYVIPTDEDYQIYQDVLELLD